MENNKLIAEFEGSMIVRNYNSDWNDLMRVVQKLKTTRKNPEHTFLTVAFGKLNQSLMEAEIEPVYRDVVDIIKLLNQLNP